MFFADGEVSGFVTQIICRRLQMQRNRVVDLGFDPMADQVIDQFIPA